MMLTITLNEHLCIKTVIENFYMDFKRKYIIFFKLYVSFLSYAFFFLGFFVCLF